MSDIRIWKRQAKEILLTRGRLVRLALCAIVLLFALMIPFLLGVYLHALLGLIVPLEDSYFGRAVLPWLLMMPFGVLLTAPLCVAVKRCVLSILEDAPLSHYRGYYLHDVAAGSIVLSRWCVPLALFVLSTGLPTYLLPKDEDSPIRWFFRGFLTVLLLIVSAMISFGFLNVTRSVFFLTHCAAKGKSVREDLASAKRMHRERPKWYWQYFGEFFGYLLLSVVTIGVLFVFYVLPLLWTTSYLAASSPSDGASDTPS